RHRTGNPCAVRRARRCRRPDMNDGSGERTVNPGTERAVSSESEAISTCPKCGTKMPASRSVDRCPVCQLRAALDPELASQPRADPGNSIAIGTDEQAIGLSPN